MRTDTDSTLSPLFIRFFASMIFLALGAGVEWFLSDFRQQQSAVRQSSTELEAKNLRARLEGELNAVIFLSNALAGYWAGRHASSNQEEARNILAETFRRSRHIKSIAIFEDRRIAYVFPQDEDSQPIGFDFQTHPDQKLLIQRFEDTNAGLLVSPEPSSGKLAYLVPILADGGHWGFVSARIDDASLFSASGISRSSGHLQCALCVTNGDCEMQNIVAGLAELFDDPSAATLDIAIPGGTWRLAVKSNFTSTPDHRNLLFRGLGWLLAGLFAYQSAVLLKLRHSLSDLALYDGLTGLPSRHLFLDRLRQMIRRTQRNRGNFSVLYISLDDLGAINDRQGPKAGNMMLAGIGQRLIGSIRHCDTVTRWRGYEFLVLLDACPLNQARIIAENLRHKIELPVSYGDQILRVGASIGLATYPEDGRSLAALIKLADVRMQEDKNRR